MGVYKTETVPRAHVLHDHLSDERGLPCPYLPQNKKVSQPIAEIYAERAIIAPFVRPMVDACSSKEFEMH